MRARPLALVGLLLGAGVPSAIRADEGEAAKASPWAKDVAALTEGVPSVRAPGALPGAVVPFGDDAFPVLLGSAGAARRSPMAAAARLGAGRVVIVGHDAFVSPGVAADAATRRFFGNALRWAAGGRPARGLRVGTIGVELSSLLKPAGFDAARVDERPPIRLSKVDVVVVSGSPREADLEAVEAHVRAGGGLVAGMCPWGWLQVSKAKDLRESALQHLVGKAGLAFSEETVEETSGPAYLVAGAPGLPFHAARAVELLAATAGKPGTGPELVQAAHVARLALAVLPDDEKQLRARVRALLRLRAAERVPTEAKPLRGDRPLDRFLLAAEVAELARLEPKDVRAHPAAAEFPGAVPAGAARTKRSVPIELGVPGWHSTGLYAPPGARITARLATDERAAWTGTLGVRIGCHADTLWHLEAWPRVPELTTERSFAPDDVAHAVAARPPTDDVTIELASAFGGPVYVVVGGRAQGRTTVELDGAVEAPLFVLGTTTKSEWARSRRAPGPWAELVTSKLVLSVPSEQVRGLDDPAALLAFWDRVLDADADLAGIPRARTRPERIVADVEISAGYMHSGYPIMTHLDAAPRMVDVSLLSTKGDWGLFHELGHNHQEPEWTFDGTTEVTCNLFALCVLQTVCGLKELGGHEALVDREARSRAHAKAGAPFATWQRDPFLALGMYTQLIEGFGWEPFRQVFAAYRTVAGSDRPKDDAAKRDQWMVRMSRATGRNLGPFFLAWGVPVSDAARASIAALPAWMPEGFPGR